MASKPQDSTPTLVAFATQKGGVGKSTTATLVASDLYFRQNRRIVFLDADDPQHSVYHLREQEKKQLREDERFQREFQRRGRVPLYPVLATSMKGMFERTMAPGGEPQASPYEVATAEEIGAEYVIIDTPGSTTSPGYASALARVDTIVVPLEPEEMSLKSTTQFLITLRRTLDTSGSAAKVTAFWNKVRDRSHAADVTAHSEAFRARGFEVLTEYLPDVVSMTRRETRSTVIAADLRRAHPKLPAFLEALTAKF